MVCTCFVGTSLEDSLRNAQASSGAFVSSATLARLGGNSISCGFMRKAVVLPQCLPGMIDAQGDEVCPHACRCLSRNPSNMMLITAAVPYGCILIQSVRELLVEWPQPRKVDQGMHAQPHHSALQTA